MTPYTPDSPDPSVRPESVSFVLARPAPEAMAAELQSYWTRGVLLLTYGPPGRHAFFN